MPQITFSSDLGLPNLSQVKGDYFWESSPPKTPKIPQYKPKGGIFDKAGKAIGKFTDGIKLKDFKFSPLPEDAIGCPVGEFAAKRAAVLNYQYKQGYTLHKICEEFMDDPQYGFMPYYNFQVQNFWDNAVVFSEGLDDESRIDIIGGVWKQARGEIISTIRMYNALFKCAWGKTVQLESLEIGDKSTISRESVKPLELVD